MEHKYMFLLETCLVPKKICTEPVTLNVQTYVWGIKCS